MMTHDELEEAVPLYAIGALERPERQALEAHLLSGCGTCHAALKDYQGVACLLPFALPPVAPPTSLRAKVLDFGNGAAADVEDAKPPATPSLEPGQWLNHLFPPLAPARSRSLQLGLALLVVLSLAGAGYVAWRAHVRSTEESDQAAALQTQLQSLTAQTAVLQARVAERETLIKQLRDELDVRRSDLTELRDQLIQREADLDALRAQLAQQDGARKHNAHLPDDVSGMLVHPHAKVVPLSGTERAREAGALLIVDGGGKKAWLYAYNLPDLPAGTVYQLWVVDEKPVSIGIFTIDAGHKGRLSIKGTRNLSTSKHIVVSLEPAGGRPQPSGPAYLVNQAS